MAPKTPKLRMAPPETPGQIAESLRIENRARVEAREAQAGLGKFRVGSVPYLNAAPLTRGIENEVLFAPPAVLAEKLHAGELDAALLSITEPLLHNEYDILDGIAVASLGEVKSVFLAHRKPLEDLEEIFCDPASLTSVNLLRVLMGEKGLTPQLKPFSPPGAPWPDAFLLIGDPAIAFLLSEPEHRIWDLGAAWMELTGLPFVYAAWVLRRGLENSALREELRSARDLGLDTLDFIIRDRKEFTPDFRRDYLGWHIHYHLGSDEKKGILRFAELLRKHLKEPVFDPVYVR